MGRITRKKVNTCELCCGIMNKSSQLPSNINHQNSSNQMWNYLYHKNVKEALLPSSTEGNDENSGIPKLSFSLTLGKAVNIKEANVLIEICDECTLELDKLDKLHEQLELVKKLINVQISKINDNRWNNETSPLNKGKLQKKKNSMASFQPPAGINFAGCSIGKENISQTLTFLSTICGGIPSSPPSTSSFPKTKLQKEKREIETQDDQLNLREDMVTNGYENLSNESSDMMDKALDIDVGEELVSIVKMEDDFDKEDSIEVPEKDPLEIPVDAKTKRKYEKRPDYPVGKGPKMLPCSLCKKTVFRWNWEMHQKWHAGEKQFKCGLCPERFTTKRSMQRHNRWHQKEFWQHQCDLCDKKFQYKYKLVLHQKSCQS